MTMFDRLTAAIEREMIAQEMVLTDPLSLRRLKAQRIARTVLRTLRNPTIYMHNAGSVARYRNGEPVMTCAEIFTAMIEAAEEDAA